MAVSPTGHLLATASALPPVLRIQNLRVHDAPLVLKPSASDAVVIVATFHPKRPTIFALGFADGTVVMYDARRLFHNGGFGERKDGPASTGTGGEIGYVRNVHDGGRGGITAIEFLSTYSARLITAGLDGRCVVLDFSAVIKMQGMIVNRWHVQGAVTCVAVLPIAEQRHSTRPADDAEVEYLIAIGREDGEVLLQTSCGVLLAEKLLDHGNHPILDLEWTTENQASIQRKISRSSTRTNLKHPQRPSFLRRKSSSIRLSLNGYRLRQPSQRRRRAGKSSTTSTTITTIASILGKGRRTREEILEYTAADRNDKDDASDSNETFITAQTSLSTTLPPAQPTRPAPPPPSSHPLKINTNTNVNNPQLPLDSPSSQPANTARRPSTKSKNRSRQKSIVEIDMDRGVDINDLIPPRTSSTTTATSGSGSGETTSRRDSSKCTNALPRSIGGIGMGDDTTRTRTAVAAGGRTGRRDTAGTTSRTIPVGESGAREGNRGAGGNTGGDAAGDDDQGDDDSRLQGLEARISAVEKRIAALSFSTS